MNTPADGTVFTDSPSRKTPILARRVTPVAFMIELGAGSPVGEYELEAQIGEGGMGTVYTAVHPVLGKHVAIKILKAELCTNPGAVDRFVHEAQAITKIGHPNIVDVYSLGELPDGRAYFVMELLRGEDLRARLRRGHLSILDACDILDGIARALQAAHGKSIVHRDLKPDNVFLHQPGDGGPPQVKLLDFGIAKLIRPADQAQTATGNILGTPRYCSPEQARGISLDHRSDIYSLGVMAYEMLAGRPPFQAETAVDIVLMHVNQTAPPLAEFARVPKALEQLVMRMLAKDPNARPSLEEVRTILVDPSRRVTPMPGRLTGTLPSMMPRPKRWQVLALGVAAVAVIGGILWQVGRNASAPVEHTPIVIVPQPPVVLAPASAPVVPKSTLGIEVIGATDAEILVDGVQAGRGSLVKVPVEGGSHAIEVKPPRGASVKREVITEAGRDQSVTIEVEKPVVKSSPPIKSIKRSLPPSKPVEADPEALMRPKKR